MSDAAGVVRDLFGHYMTHPGDMPDEWHLHLPPGDDEALTLRVGDFIAGMTDRFALAEHARFFDSTPELR
jgi:dGTPase